MDKVWTVKTILEWIEGYLAEHGDANPRLAAQWLVSDALHCSRIELFTMLDRVLTDEEREILRGYTTRRGTGEPLQYITGTTDFRFITVAVEPGVLIPRPETEVLVSEALAELNRAFPPSSAQELPAYTDEDLMGAQLISMDEAGLFLQLDTGEPIPVALDSEGDVVLRAADINTEEMLVADLCTGSGNIACSLASEDERLRVFATDISPAACALARRNVEALGLAERVVVAECDLGAALPQDMYGKVHLLISNPPYIPSAELAQLSSEVADFEPVLALDGGQDGLDVFNRILSFAQDVLCPGGVLAVELHETCLDEAAARARQAGFNAVRIAADLAKKPRILVSQK